MLDCEYSGLLKSGLMRADCIYIKQAHMDRTWTEILYQAAVKLSNVMDVAYGHLICGEAFHLQ